MRIAIVGGGLAGSLLAWRLAAPPGVQVDLYSDLPALDPPRGGTEPAGRAATPEGVAGRLDATAVSGGLVRGSEPAGRAAAPDGVAGRLDATAVSGGLVRGFETDLPACLDAAESLAELVTSPVLRDWAGYVEAGSTYTCTVPPDGKLVSAVEDRVPGSIEADGVVVRERRAGWISPDRLRRAVLADAAAAGLTIHSGRVGELPPADLTVLATGRWTGQLLGRLGLPGAYRTKLIQVARWPVRGSQPGPFVHEPTGLYGRPDGDQMLVGLATSGWDVDPDDPGARPDLLAATRVAAVSLDIVLDQPSRVIAAADCYTDPPGLRLREVAGRPDLLTFTGGSGGAAKTALAASRAAAAVLHRHS